MAKKPTPASGKAAAKSTGGSKKIDDMRVKTEDQLTGDLSQLKREAFNLRFQAATNQLERPARIKEVRRDIARVKTLQNERSRAAETKA